MNTDWVELSVVVEVAVEGLSFLPQELTLNQTHKIRRTSRSFFIFTSIN